jgi:hypothetical protein
MGKKKPSKLIDWFVKAIIPPSAREEVIGDLWESYSTSLRYILEGIAIMPYAIANQMRHQTVIAVLALQGFALFACFGGFSPYPSGGVVPNWARAAVPTIAALIGLALRDAYRAPSLRPLPSGIIDAVTAAICILFAEAALTLLITLHQLNSSWALTTEFLTLGSLAVPTVGILRIASGLDHRSRLASGDVGTSDLAGEYAKFKRGVDWRNLAEICACLTVIGINGYYLFRYKPVVALAGWTMLCIWLALTVYLALRGWAKIEPSDPGQIPVVYQRELRRQHALRRLMWWWWFVPLFVGLGNNFILRGFLRNHPVEIAIGGLAAVVLAFFIAKLIMDRGRLVRSEIAALHTMIKN